MNKQPIIALSLLGFFVALTGIFFGIRGYYESTSGYVCQYLPLSSVVDVSGNDIICVVTTNFTMSCGDWEVVDVIVKESCHGIDDKSIFDVGISRYYLYREYVCRADSCNRDNTLYHDNIISSFMIAGALSATFAAGFVIYAIVMWCGGGRRHIGPS